MTTTGNQLRSIAPPAYEEVNHGPSTSWQSAAPLGGLLKPPSYTSIDLPFSHPVPPFHFPEIRLPTPEPSAPSLESPMTPNLSQSFRQSVPREAPQEEPSYFSKGHCCCIVFLLLFIGAIIAFVLLAAHFKVFGDLGGNSGCDPDEQCYHY